MVDCSTIVFQKRRKDTVFFAYAQEKSVKNDNFSSNRANLLAGMRLFTYLCNGKQSRLIAK